MEKYLTEFAPLPFERTYNDVNIYGKRLRQLREERHETCREVADNTKIAHSTITKIENGMIKKINLNYLNLLSAYFNCSPLYLLGKCDSISYHKGSYIFLNPENDRGLLDFLFEENILDSYYTMEDCRIVVEKIIKKDGVHHIIPLEKSCKLSKNKIIAEAKNNKYGIRVTINEQIRYYIYYFSQRAFKTEVCLSNLTTTEEANSKYKRLYRSIIAGLGEANQKNENALRYIEKHSEAIEDILVIQDCSNHIMPVTFQDVKREPQSLYLAMLKDIFYVDDTFQLKNLPILEMLYAMPHLKSNEIINLLVTIIRSDAFCRSRADAESKTGEKQQKAGQVTYLMSQYMKLFLELDYETLQNNYMRIKKENNLR